MSFLLQNLGVRGIDAARAAVRRLALALADYTAPTDREPVVAESIYPPAHDRYPSSSNRCYMQDETRKALFATLGDLGLRARDHRLSIASRVLKRDVVSFTDLSEYEGRRLIESLVHVIA